MKFKLITQNNNVKCSKEKRQKERKCEQGFYCGSTNPSYVHTPKLLSNLEKYLTVVKSFLTKNQSHALYFFEYQGPS